MPDTVQDDPQLGKKTLLDRQGRGGASDDHMIVRGGASDDQDEGIDLRLQVRKSWVVCWTMSGMV